MVTQKESRERRVNSIYGVGLSAGAVEHITRRS